MQAEPPRWLWECALWALTLALAGGALLSAAIGAGWNNPRPPFPPGWQFRSTLELTAVPRRWTVYLLGQPVGPFILEAVATPLEGADLSSYGLVFRAQSPKRYRLFAVGPDGYLAVLQVEGERETPLLDWQQFPHIRRGRAANRLRVSCAGGNCHFWINDEYVAAVPDGLGPTGDVGLWAQGAEEEKTQIRFEQVSLWTEKSAANLTDTDGHEWAGCMDLFSRHPVSDPLSTRGQESIPSPLSLHPLSSASSPLARGVRRKMQADLT